MFRSPYPHAEIVSLDTAAARRALQMPLTPERAWCWLAAAPFQRGS
jgi:hypothetical protein